MKRLAICTVVALSLMVVAGATRGQEKPKSVPAQAPASLQPAAAGPAVSPRPAGTSAVSQASAQAAPGTASIQVQVGTATRTCLVHLPPVYDGQRALPLVIVLHGSGGTDTGMANSTGFSKLADKQGFIAAYPNGIVGGNRGWNALFGKPIPGGTGAQVDDVDDVGFIRTLIDQMHSAYHTDPSRVFVCGHSSGAYMAYRAAIDLADRVAAVGVVNGSLGIRLLDSKPSIPDIPAPVAPVSVMHVRGAKDNLVKAEGGQTERVLAKSVAECVQRFVQADGCATPGRATTDTEHGVSRTLYSGGKAGTEVELVIVDQANHNWPSPREGFSTSQELWDFFSKHPKSDKPQ